MISKDEYIKLRDKAQRKAQYAVRQGKIPPPTDFECVDCGVPATCYDHRDYERPLEVEPVCTACNHKRGPGAPFYYGSHKRRHGLSSNAGEGFGLDEAYLAIDFDFAAYDDHIEYLYYESPYELYVSQKELNITLNKARAA